MNSHGGVSTSLLPWSLTRTPVSPSTLFCHFHVALYREIFAMKNATFMFFFSFLFFSFSHKTLDKRNSQSKAPLDLVYSKIDIAFAVLHPFLCYGLQLTTSQESRSISYFICELLTRHHFAAVSVCIVHYVSTCSLVPRPTYCKCLGLGDKAISVVRICLMIRCAGGRRW